jgi:hypothetical protein
MAKKKRRGEMQEVPLEDIQPGPVRHKKGLSPVLEGLSRTLFSQVGHFVYPSFEQWELGFMRDKHPWREILIWENIARTFDRYISEHPDADGRVVIGSIAAVSAGQAPENEIEKELRELYLESHEKRWDVPPGEPFEFPEGKAVVLQFEDIVDEWDGGVHPNIRRQVDSRRILADADIILGMEPESEQCFCIFGTERLEEGRVPEGQRTLVIHLNPENEKTQELAKMCYAVEKVKGRHDLR